MGGPLAAAIHIEGWDRQTEKKTSQSGVLTRYVKTVFRAEFDEHGIDQPMPVARYTGCTEKRDSRMGLASSMKDSANIASREVWVHTYGKDIYLFAWLTHEELAFFEES